MAPKRGLKASAKAVAVATPAEAVERTYPLDEDALTLSDLFELRQSSVSSPTPDDARGLLRGILHGTQSLLSLPAGTARELRGALGLERALAQSALSYLTAFALHELASVPPPSLNPTRGTRGGKKAKLDLREPTTPDEWLDEAIAHYDAALAALPAAAAADPETIHWTTLVRSDSARARAERAGLAMRAGDKPTTAGLAASLAAAGAAWASYAPPHGERPWEDQLGSPSASLLRALAELLNVVDGESLDDVRAIAAVLASTPLTEERDRDALAADVGLAEFTMLSEAVEDKYRPIASDDEDEDGDVVPLPDQSDVRDAKDAGTKAIASLRKVIDHLPAVESSTTDEKETRMGWFKKLEEAYLTLSALINPDDVERTKDVEAALEACRTEGGIEVDEDE